MSKSFPGVHQFLIWWTCSRCGHKTLRSEGRKLMREHLGKHPGLLWTS